MFGLGSALSLGTEVNWRLLPFAAICPLLSAAADVCCRWHLLPQLLLPLASAAAAVCCLLPLVPLLGAAAVRCRCCCHPRGYVWGGPIVQRSRALLSGASITGEQPLRPNSNPTVPQANNRYDQAYVEHFTGIRPLYLPTLANYITARYRPAPGKPIIMARSHHPTSGGGC